MKKYIENQVLMRNKFLLDSGKGLKFYIEQFWVGLLEGDGSIVIRRNKGNKSYGVFEISLKYLTKNEELLKLISYFIGGTVYYEKKNKEIIKVKWLAISKKDVQNCVNILTKYPLLTSRKICQLDHLLKCIEIQDWNYHLNTRAHKYDMQPNLIEYNTDFKIPTYFKGWVSGFVEAEGCFRMNKNKASSFYISQNNDLYIIKAIQTLFNSNHKIGIHKDLRTKVDLSYKNVHYRISISGKPCLNLIKNHFSNYPLLGNKLESYSNWSNSI
uniref:Homing endonuclease LAGLIDADG domain-containing protein n=1 Tax=Mutinus fleischeri TaxID=2218478 RepID=A0A8K1RBV9_9AGAM|nr:hypothetical protein [Mutinus fleischeri]